MNWDDATLFVQPLPSGERKIVQRGGSYGRYLASGHIVYLHDAKIFAVPFDLDRLEVTRPPFLALDGVGSNPNGGAAQFAASETGTFVYLSRPIGSAPMGGAPIQWMDRAGRRTPLRATLTNWGNPRFSPDGTRLAVEINDGKQYAIWVYEWEHDRASQLTLNPAQNQKPVWTPDGRRIVFWSNRDVQQNLYWQRADGTGDTQRLTNSPYPQSAASWHPGGRILAFQETRPHTGADLMVVAIEGDELTGWKPGTPTSFLSTAALEREPMFSPDGKWLAYQSNELGQFEVYVRPFPGPGGSGGFRRQVGSPPHGRGRAAKFSTAAPRISSWPPPTRCRATPSAPRNHDCGPRVTSDRRQDNARSICTPTASASPSPPSSARSTGRRIDSSSFSTSSTSYDGWRRLPRSVKDPDRVEVRNHFSRFAFTVSSIHT
jgi:serine/threonine-protein kinase